MLWNTNDHEWTRTRDLHWILIRVYLCPFVVNPFHLRAQANGPTLPEYWAYEVETTSPLSILHLPSFIIHLPSSIVLLLLLVLDRKSIVRCWMFDPLW